MLDKNKIKQFIEPYSKEQIAWLSGYLAAIASGGDPSNINQAMPKITILYATETGNSKNIALEFAGLARQNNIKAKSQDVASYRLRDLEKEEYIYFIISTHGEGEPPETAKEFFAHIDGLAEKSLQKLQYSILALGDSSYPLFCEAAILLDKKLQKVGAKRLNDIVQADVDFEEPAEIWQKQNIEFLQKQNNAEIIDLPIAKPKSKIGYNRKNTVKGELIHKVNLNDIGSNKQTYHLEIALPEELEYQPGDAIGIITKDDKDKRPRLYSVASAINAFENEAHLTVGVVKNGLCSNYLANLQQDAELELYVHRNRQFHLPESDKDLIMVGAGTGIAPFRGFLQEREFQAATGKNWLFFGEQYAQSDFLYQAEWQDYIKTGLLSKVDLAFSRHQKDKIYVQHRVAQQAEEIFSWLENGAYFYICGSKDMGAAVQDVLLSIIAERRDNAQDYVKKLRAEQRLRTDLY